MVTWLFLYLELLILYKRNINKKFVNNNENINILLDLFDKEVNTNINSTQISPLDKLNALYLEKDEDMLNSLINGLLLPTGSFISPKISFSFSVKN